MWAIALQAMLRGVKWRTLKAEVAVGLRCEDELGALADVALLIHNPMARQLVLCAQVRDRWIAKGSWGLGFRVLQPNHLCRPGSPMHA